MREVENRPEKMWVPVGATAIQHKRYVDENWPADGGVEMYIATCVSAECNVLEPQFLKSLFKAHRKVYAPVVDGDKVVETFMDSYKILEGDPETNIRQGYGGKKWVLDRKLYPGEELDVHSKCLLFNADTCDTTNIFWTFV